MLCKTTISACENERKFMQQLATLNVPYVVKYIAHVFHDNTYHIVMEHMNLDSLGHLIDNPDFVKFNWLTRIHLMQHITQAIQLMHKHHLIHRDIKGDNVLLQGESLKKQESITAKLADFGFGKRVDGKVECVGAPAWLAPEIMNSKPHTLKSDIYSLSMLYLEIGKWQQPYPTLDNSQIIFHVLDGKRETLPNDFPQGFANLIKRAWDNDPPKRPSADQMLQELDAVERGLFKLE